MDGHDFKKTSDDNEGDIDDHDHILGKLVMMIIAVTMMMTMFMMTME